jgi:hypothetical protein
MGLLANSARGVWALTDESPVRRARHPLHFRADKKQVTIRAALLAAAAADGDPAKRSPETFEYPAAAEGTRTTVSTIAG